MKHYIQIAPPTIEQFNVNLLSTPMPLFRENTKDLWQMYLYIKTKLMYKARNNPIRLKKCLELEQQFLELYERAMDKEQERKAETTHFTQRPFYGITRTGCKDDKLFDRLAQRKTSTVYSLCNSDHDI